MQLPSMFLSMPWVSSSLSAAVFSTTVLAHIVTTDSWSISRTAYSSLVEHSWQLCVWVKVIVLQTQPFSSQVTLNTPAQCASSSLCGWHPNRTFIDWQHYWISRGSLVGAWSTCQLQSRQLILSANLLLLFCAASTFDTIWMLHHGWLGTWC